MAILVSSTICCLNRFPGMPNSTQLSTHPNTSQFARRRPRRENSWRNQLVLGMTCAVISLHTGNLLGNDVENANAIAANMEVAANTEMKWSDKRACPAWQSNALETIVPENLPRPSFHRRWEPAGYSKIAPPPSTRITNKCFFV